jgi:maleylpyruvate isomerase
VLPERSTVQPWLKAETDRLLETVEGFWESNLADDSSLPGWTWGHLLTHIARNADALCNLLFWARTGIETPMYQSKEQRTDDINFGALRPGGAVLTDVADSAARLQAAMDGLTATDWDHEVVTAQGRTIAAAQVPWLRLREVTIHHVDLGASFAAMEPRLVSALLEDVAASIRTRLGWPPLRVATTEGDTIEIGSPGVDIRGSQTNVLAWLTGRSDGQELSTSAEALPPLPAWL